MRHVIVTPYFLPFPLSPNPTQLVLEDELSAGGSTDTIDIAKTNTTALKVNNNMLMDWEGLVDTTQRLLVSPTSQLRWLNLSFNDLKTIDSVSEWRDYRFCLKGPTHNF